MVKGGYVPGRTHPTDRARGQTTAMPTAVAAARQSYADHPMVRLETAPPGPCHAVSLQETLSGTFTACATVILGAVLARTQAGQQIPALSPHLPSGYIHRLLLYYGPLPRPRKSQIIPDIVGQQVISPNPPPFDYTRFSPKVSASGSPSSSGANPSAKAASASGWFPLIRTR